MQNFIYETAKGIRIELDENDMYLIHQHYIKQAMADYLRENYVDWSEEKVQEIAIEVQRQMEKYAFSEEEAIEIAIRLYEKNKTDIYRNENTVIHIRHRIR